MSVRSGGNNQFDPNHAGIKMVNQMRMGGKEEIDIRNRIRAESTALQQRVNGQLVGKSSPIIPDADQIEKLKTLEVAAAYSDIEDMSQRGSIEKLAKAQEGVSPTGNRLMSATWQQLRTDANAAKAPQARQPGEVRFKI